MVLFSAATGRVMLRSALDVIMRVKTGCSMPDASTGEVGLVFVTQDKSRGVHLLDGRVVCASAESSGHDVTACTHSSSCGSLGGVSGSRGPAGRAGGYRRAAACGAGP